MSKAPFSEVRRNPLKYAWQAYYKAVYSPYIKPYLKSRVGESELNKLYGEHDQSIALLTRLSQDHNLITTPEEEYAPIFICSTGWRTGSTLLQRLVMSTGEALIWGEPYSDTLPSHSLFSHLRAFKSDYPYEECFRQISSDNVTALTESWTAYLFPPMQALYNAHRSFFIKLLKEPAVEKGFKYWGMKEVRLNIDQVLYLNWLFPNAKFIFLTRNPIDAYRSYKGRKWYVKWPDLKVDTAIDFASFWSYLAKGFADNIPNLQSILVRYEDLISQEAEITKIEDFIGFQVDRQILNKRVKEPIKKHNKSLSWPEIFLIKKTAGEIAHSFGYEL